MKEMRELPKWIQDLYTTDPSSARKSEYLLEALERAYNDFTKNNWTEETDIIVRTAIKKAGGRL